MKVKVKLYTILKKYAKGKILGDGSIILKKGATLQGLTSDYLAIPDSIGVVFLVNNTPQDKDYTLCEGDEVKIFSLICGG
jgi:molybdopterin converting factor small subunit